MPRYTPFEAAAKQYAGSDSRRIPDEIADLVWAERLGISLLEMDTMSCERVWTMQGYWLGRQLAAMTHEGAA